MGMPAPYKDTKIFTILIPRALHAKMKIKCALDGISMTGVIVQMIESWVDYKDTMESFKRAHKKFVTSSEDE